MVIYVDFTSAFDSCDHNLLLGKLERYGVRGIAQNFFASLLSGRSQAVVCDYLDPDTKEKKRVKSESSSVERGVFAGTIMGPNLFNVFSNDLLVLLQKIGHHVTAYADDFAICIAAENEEEMFQKANQCMETLWKWCEHNGLLLNGQKTKYMVIGRKRTQTDLQVTVNNIILEMVKSFKYLGSVINCDLTWGENTNVLKPRLQSALHLFRFLRHSFAIEHLIIFYKAYFESLLRFGLCFWGHDSGTKKIFILQKHCLRIILRMKRNQTCRKAFIDLQIATVYDLYIYECVKFVTMNFGTLFQKHSQIHQYKTRNRENVHVPLQSQYSSKHLTTCHKIYNHFPQSIREDPMFLKKAKKFIKGQSYYNLQEFFESVIKWD